MLEPLLAVIGHRRLRDLEADDVIRGLQLVAETRSSRTVRDTRAALVRTITYAQARSLVGRNVAGLIKAPPGLAPGRPSRALTVVQAMAVLVAAAARRGADRCARHRVGPRRACAGRGPGAGGGADAPLSSLGLSDDQAQAAYGILTSGRAIDILVGAAGTGKTRTVAVLAGAWQDAGTGRVIGLTTSTSAAHTLAAEIPHELLRDR